MAHSKQAEKRNRQNIRVRAANKAQRTGMKTAMKRVSAASEAALAVKSLPEAMKRIDKAAKQGVIHKNAAARHKSRLARKVVQAAK